MKKKITEVLTDNPGQRIDFPTKLSPIRPEKGLTHVRSSALLGSPEASRMFLGEVGESRASLMFRGESAKTLEILRRENEGKELKIR